MYLPIEMTMLTHGHIYVFAHRTDDVWVPCLILQCGRNTVRIPSGSGEVPKGDQHGRGDHEVPCRGWKNSAEKIVRRPKKRSTQVLRLTTHAGGHFFNHNLDVRSEMFSGTRVTCGCSLTTMGLCGQIAIITNMMPLDLGLCGRISVCCPCIIGLCGQIVICITRDAAHTPWAYV